MNSIYVLQNYFLKYIIVLCIVSLLIFSGNFVFYKFFYNSNVQYMPKNLVYYQGEDIDDIMKYATDKNLTYYQTYPLKSMYLNDDVTGVYTTDIQIPLQTLDFSTTGNNDLVNWVSSQINENIKVYDMMISLNLNNPVINETNLKNENFGVEEIIKGGYPVEENEVLIPEIYALYLMEEQNYNSYDDLINTKINFKVDSVSYEYIICGIYSGTNKDLIINPPSKLFNTNNFKNLQNAVFIRVKSKEEKCELLDRGSPENFITSKTFIYDRLFNKIIILYDLLIIILFFLLLLEDMIKSIRTLNHYNYNYMNIVITLYIPTLLLLIVLMISLIFKV